GAVGQVADDRLHEQPGEGGGDPQQRELVHLRAEGLEDPADVRVLQCEAELDAQAPEAHVPDVTERQFRLAGAVSLHVGSPGRWRFPAHGSNGAGRAGGLQTYSSAAAARRQQPPAWPWNSGPRRDRPRCAADFGNARGEPWATSAARTSTGGVAR